MNRNIWAILAVTMLTIRCSGDPHKIVVTEEHSKDFSVLVASKKGLTPEEIELVNDAQLRIQKTHTPEKIIGRTMSEIIADQKAWRVARQQLVSKLEPVYRSAKTIQSSIEVGVTYLKYGELLQAFATELSMASDKISTDEERRIGTLFAGVLQVYRDAGSLWKNQIENAQYEDLFDGGVNYSLKGLAPDGELKRIVDLYKIPIRNGRIKYSGGSYQALPKNSMQIVWVSADKDLSDALGAYSMK